MKTLLTSLSVIALSIAVFSQADVGIATAKINPHRSAVPSYCAPCLFYGGDFDVDNPNANALDNLDAYLGKQYAAVYVPFVVPTGQKWVVTGMFSNLMSDTPYISPAQIEWAIASGISAGNPGTVVAGGHVRASYTPTGRTWRSYTEYTALGRLTPLTSVTLASGLYWVSVVPVCKTPDKCSGGPVYLLSDVEDVPAQNAKGIAPNNHSFFNYPGLYNYAPTWGKGGACGGIGCNRFSIGLLGHAEPAHQNRENGE